MFRRLLRMFDRSGDTHAATEAGDRTTEPATASERSRIRELELELEEARATLERLRDQVARDRDEATEREHRAVDAAVRELLASLAPAVTQLNTQGYLIEREGRPVRAGDVLQVVARLSRALEDAGLRVHDDVGERVAFDPALHEPLDAADALQPGDAALVRFAGIDHGSRTLRRAGVTRAPEDDPATDASDTTTTESDD